MICAVNKMDSNLIIDKQSKFNEIKDKMNAILKKIGYKPDKTTFIPVSGWRGDNIVNRWSQSYFMPWYNGLTLLEALENLTCPKRPTDKPLRIVV